MEPVASNISVRDLEIVGSDIVAMTSDGILRVPRDGGTPIAVSSVVPTPPYALDAAHAYFVGSGGTSLSRVDLATGAEEQVATFEADSVESIAVGVRSVYLSLKGISVEVVACAK